MNDFEQQVRRHLALFEAPDYTAKGDSVNFFKLNAKKAIPILERRAKEGNKNAAQMLSIARSALEDKPKKGTFMENNRDLF